MITAREAGETAGLTEWSHLVSCGLMLAPVVTASMWATAKTHAVQAGNATMKLSADCPSYCLLTQRRLASTLSGTWRRLSVDMLRRRGGGWKKNMVDFYLPCHESVRAMTDSRV